MLIVLKKKVNYIFKKAFFIGFIFLFAYVILCDFYPLYVSELLHPMTTISIPEIVLIIWTSTYGMEEIRQVDINNLLTYRKTRLIG